MLHEIGYPSNKEYQRKWCTNSYYEMLSYVQTGHTRDGKHSNNVDPRNLDIFFEHCTCDVALFAKFMSLVSIAYYR